MTHPSDSQANWQRLRSSSKKFRGGLYTRYINRNAAIPVTWVLWKLGLSPNAVSIISFCVTHSAFAVLILTGPTIPAAISAYLLLVIGYMLDSCDGQLARVTGRTSSLGAWLDHSLDIVKIININLALSYVMLAAVVSEGASLTLPFLAAALNLLSQPAHFFIVNMKCMVLEADSSIPNDSTAPSGRGGIGGTISFAVVFLADYGIFIMIVLLLPWQQAFVPVYLGYGVFALLLMIAHFLRASMRIARQTEGPS